MSKRVGVLAASVLVIGAASVATFATDTAILRFDNLKSDLVLTHYCAQGNQPHMKAVNGGDANAIAFKFDGGGNMTTTWLFYRDGKAGESKEFALARMKS